MKSLLSMLALASFATSIAVPLANQNVTHLNQSDKQSESVEFYWNQNHSELEILNEWKTDANRLFVHTINIGQTKLSDYKTFSVIDPNNKSYTKTSWGNDAYFGTPFRNLQKIAIDRVFHEKKIVRDYVNYANIILLNKTDVDGLAIMATIQAVGLSSYYENGDNHLQIFSIQCAETWNSFSGGAMWLNLGQGIRLES